MEKSRPNWIAAASVERMSGSDSAEQFNISSVTSDPKTWPQLGEYYLVYGNRNIEDGSRRKCVNIKAPHAAGKKPGMAWSCCEKGHQRHNCCGKK